VGGGEGGENFDDEDDFVEILTRSRFEELNADLFQKTMIPVQNVIRDSGLSKSEIDDVILVGGSSGIPKIQQLIRNFFNEKQPSKSINLEDAIARGAAIQAALLSDEVGTCDVTLVNVNLLTLGVETAGGKMSAIIPRNSKVPTVRSKIFTTSRDNQENLWIEVFEGQRPVAKDNNLLGSFSLDRIRRAPKGVPQINVTFVLDADGILDLWVWQDEITIRADDGRLSDEQMEWAIARAERMMEEDERVSQATKSKSRFWVYLMEQPSKIGGQHNRATVTKVRDWLTQQPDEPNDVCDQKLKQLREKFNDMLKALRGRGAA
jgi:heat shock protein 5